MTEKVITRFAPSPTGYLHIGSARTALFNYLFARANNGKFLLRIEDTDKARSSKEAIDAIISGMQWLALDWDGDIIFQSDRANRHAEVAQEMLKNGTAYLCFASQEEIEEQRTNAIAKQEAFIFKSPWREADAKSYPKEIQPVVRLKAPRIGSTIINDKVKGIVEVQNSQLDDMILLRSDGTPTYMLAVVVDDHDAGITHIIRGDDHLSNSPRQALIYQAMGWQVPIMAHIPLIHGQDGHKLSKRHGALGVDSYKDMGYLSDAMFNYLLRLGWSHGDDEIMSRDMAIKWFNLESLGTSAARLDFAKMQQLNSYYIQHKTNEEVFELIKNELKSQNRFISESEEHSISNAIEYIKTRAIFKADLITLTEIFLPSKGKLIIDEESQTLLKDTSAELISDVKQIMEETQAYDKETLLAAFKLLSKKHNLKLANIMLLLRALITGKLSGPGIIEIMEIIGKEECLIRFDSSCLQKN
ncbi:MAG: glutamate--tRNA ligase [Rickettsiaceae bacterium]|nr:glutamate--tRNA ligase [Rickettsiaceae bacterium]